MAWKVFSKWFGRSSSGHERQLLERCHGDRELMERLITHELARLPKLSRAGASRSAIDRWNRDR